MDMKSLASKALGKKRSKDRKKANDLISESSRRNSHSKESMKAPRFMTKKEKEAREAIERKKIEFEEKQKCIKELEKRLNKCKKKFLKKIRCCPKINKIGKIYHHVSEMMSRSMSTQPKKNSNANQESSGEHSII